MSIYQSNFYISLQPVIHPLLLHRKQHMMEARGYTPSTKSSQI